MGIVMATIITMATGTVSIITDILTGMLTATIITIPTAMTMDTVKRMIIRTGTAIIMITGKAGKSSWSRTSSPTTTCWPSATADISRRKTSRR